MPSYIMIKGNFKVGSGCSQIALPSRCTRPQLLTARATRNPTHRSIPSAMAVSSTCKATFTSPSSASIGWQSPA